VVYSFELSAFIVHKGAADRTDADGEQLDGTNPSIGALILQSNGPLYGNTVIGTLAVDGGELLHLVQRGRAWTGCDPQTLYQSRYCCPLLCVFTYPLEGQHKVRMPQSTNQ